MKYLLSICFLGLLTSTYAACPVWVEADYDTDVNSYTNGEGTPRGYRQTTIPNPETAKDSDYPCITVETENADTQYVEIAAQTTQIGGSSRICIAVQGLTSLTCGGGMVVFCGKVPVDDPEVTFNCEGGGCDQSSTSIYYRANTSRSDLDDENWCANRPEDFPSGLITFVPPTDITRQTQFTESALNLSSFSLTVLLGLALSVMMIRQLLRI